MFTDIQTNNTIHAELDSTVIHATHRPQDLIPAFLEVIRDTPEYLQINIPSHAMEDDDAEWWESEDASYLLNEELFEVLNSYAPEGYYFGSHIGNGSDFGYWKEEEDYQSSFFVTPLVNEGSK